MRGYLLAVCGSILWGASGPVSDYLFKIGFTPEWLIGLKMTLSGIILLGLAIYFHQNIFGIWRNWKNALWLIAYSFLGVTAVQYLYLLTVKASEAATATIMQTLGVVIIIVLSTFIFHEAPRRVDVIAVVVALLGTWLLVTRGNLFHLGISPNVLWLGLTLALSGALYSLLPVKLLQFSTWVMVGWAMLIGGVAFEFIHPFWEFKGPLNVPSMAAILFNIFLGTALAYLLYGESLHYVSPTVAGLLNTFEPLTATIGTVMFFGLSFNWAEILGGLLIISTVFILALDKSGSNDNIDKNKSESDG